MHEPVLLKESLEILDLREGDVYMDATLGMGGHAEEVQKRWGSKVDIIGIDADESAVTVAETRVKGRFLVQNFRRIDKAVEVLGVRPTKILFDLGWNKGQFDSSIGEARGFSFERDEPLIMTLGRDSETGFNANEVVNEWEEENLRTIIKAYGEEKFATRIAREIVEHRPIKTSRELAEIIKNAVPIWTRFNKLHPATKTFQALRIAVNDELRALQEGLEKAFSILDKGGRVAVISFHSLEDRIVKNFFKKIKEEYGARLLTKKPIVPSESEVVANRRSRSAKLRAIEK